MYSVHHVLLHYTLTTTVITTFPQNLATPQIVVAFAITPYISVDSNALEMLPPGNGSIDLEVLSMRIRSGATLCERFRGQR